MTEVTATQMRSGIYLVDVLVRAAAEQRMSLETIRTRQVPLPNGRTVPLSQIASVEYDQEYPIVWRRDREGVHADFVMHASDLLLRAYTRDDIALTGDEQRLIGLINRIRFFAPPAVIDGAEAVQRTIVANSLKPSVEIRELSMQALANGLEPDPVVEFSRVCRAGLDSVDRTVA